jgi:4-hydroxythreonine-4-phosphate dehydrogenase
MERPIRVALSAGEPAGIGPELLVHAAARGLSPSQNPSVQLIAICDPQLLSDAAHSARSNVTLRRFDHNDATPTQPGELLYLPVSLQHRNEFGFLRQGNAHFVISVLQRAAAGCLSGEFDAMVTGPVHKGVINDAGIAFTGHTEYLQQLSGAKSVVMLLSCEALRVALATTHIPLKRVSVELTRESLQATLLTLERGLRQDFGIDAPNILVLGLNPHAGEGGHLGDEEINVITPVIRALNARGMHLIGPVSADTAFVPSRLRGVDCVLAMYHDQGLPVLKTLGFGNAINVTVGLPFVRTSVDHGTALELAGKGLAEPGSMFAAIDQAIQLARLRRSTTNTRAA